MGWNEACQPLGVLGKGFWGKGAGQGRGSGESGVTPDTSYPLQSDKDL